MNKPKIDLNFLGQGEFRYEEEKKMSEDVFREQQAQNEKLQEHEQVFKQMITKMLEENNFPKNNSLMLLSDDIGEVLKEQPNLPSQQLIQLFNKRKVNFSCLAHIKGYSNFILMKKENQILKDMDSSEWNPLIWAIFFGQNSLLQQILDQGGLVHKLETD